MGLDDIVDAREYYNQDLVRKVDLLASQYDIGQGKLFTGAVHSTWITALGALRSSPAYSFYDAVIQNLSLSVNTLYETAFVWGSLAAGIGFGLAETSKQRILPGIATVGLMAYSANQALAAYGVSGYYLFSGAALGSGLTLSVLASALAPVAAVFGLGWAGAMIYKHFIKGRKHRKKK